MNLTLQHILAPVINQVSAWISVFWINLEMQNLALWQIIVDILLITVIFYWLLVLIRGTRSSAVSLGILVLVLFYSFAQIFGLMGSSWIFAHVATVVIIAIPIIFQPELRSGLERLGRAGKINKATPMETKHKIEVVLEALKYLTKNKLGATIVIGRDTPIREYAETGVMMNARASAELLISIFQKKSPLHDGAVILRDGKVMAASAVLPLSLMASEKSWGTRHKSALGLSEVSDAIVITASEERKVLTLFMDGEYIERISEKRLREVLEKELLPRKYRIKNKK